MLSIRRDMLSSRQHFCAAFFNKCFHGFGGIKISVFLSFLLKNKCFHSSFWKKTPTDEPFQKCCRIDEICCRFDEISGNVVESTRNGVESRNVVESARCCRVDENSGNVVESTRNVVESTTFCFLLGKKEKLSNRQEMSFRKCCRIDEKCCRVDDIFNFHWKMTKVVNSCRVDFRSNRRETLSSRRHFQCSTGKGKSCQIDEYVVESTKLSEMLSSRREMLSSRRHIQFSTGKGKELSTRQQFRKCCRTDEKCCRVGDTGNGVESTRNVV